MSCEELVGAGHIPTLKPERHASAVSENQVCADVTQASAAATASRRGRGRRRQRGAKAQRGAEVGGIQMCARSPGPAPARPGGPCW